MATRGQILQSVITAVMMAALAYQAGAQALTDRDSILVGQANADILNPKDSVNESFAMLPEMLEYIPADETPELIADRLACIQQTVPLKYNDKTHSFINYFLIKDRDYTRMTLRKKNLYFPLFEKYLAQYNLPEELKYLSVIESGLNPKAVSRARAVGLWQFMSATGKYYGLKHDWYFDERMDPEKSTEAACKFLSQLYDMFHDWELALAAYNSGPGTVYRAIRRSGYKKTFWEIYPYLPRETRAYVPQYVAIIYALNHASEHNLHEPASEELMPHDTLVVKRFLHFETFASLTGTCLEDLQKLNPSVQRNAIPENGKENVLRIPLYAKLNLEKNRASILDSASKVGKKELEMLAKNTAGSTYGRELVRYTVKPGDGVGLIAQRHHVRVSDLRAWNNLNSDLIHPGQRLNVWVLPGSDDAGKPAGLPQPVVITPDTKIYTVQPGDSLWDISRKFQGLTIEKIKALNNLKSNKLQPGQKLIIG